MTEQSDRLERLRNRSGSAERVAGSPEEVADRMVATVRSGHPWDNQIGPFYDTSGVTTLLGIVEQALAERVRCRTVLAAKTDDGVVLYPVWQFDGTDVSPAIRQTLNVFRESTVDGWALGAWFTTPAAALNGFTPCQWANQGHDLDALIAVAQEAAHRWAV